MSTRSVDSTRTSTPGQVSRNVVSAVAHWAKVRRSTPTSPRYSSRAVPSCGVSYDATLRTVQVVVRRSTSRVTDQVTSAGSSDEESAPDRKDGGSTPESFQSGSSTEPPWTVKETGAGGAIVFGQSEPATDRRGLWPGSGREGRASGRSPP